MQGQQQQQQQQQQAKPQGSVAPVAPRAGSTGSPKPPAGRGLNRTLTAGTTPGSPSIGPIQLAKAVPVNIRGPANAAPVQKAPAASSGVDDHVRVREWLRQMELHGPQGMVNPDGMLDSVYDPVLLTGAFDSSAGSLSCPAPENGCAESGIELIPAATATVVVRGLPPDPAAKAAQGHMGRGGMQAN
jgi:hypothetical protein